MKKSIKSNHFMCLIFLNFLENSLKKWCVCVLQT